MYKLLTDTMIDTVQSVKKVTIETFVKHEGLAKSLTEFVNAQTEYTKKAVDASIDAGKKVTAVITDKKFYEGAVKSLETLVPTVKKGK